MKTLKLTQSTMEKRISRFLDLEPLPIQIDEDYSSSWQRYCVCKKTTFSHWFRSIRR